MPTNKMMPGMEDAAGAGDKSLINKKRLLEIVQNYEISGLSIKENDDGSASISFNTLSRSQQDGIDAAHMQQQQQEMQNISTKPLPGPGSEEMDVIEEPMPAAASASPQIMVRVAKELQTSSKPNPFEVLAKKYPRKYLKSMGIIEE